MDIELTSQGRARFKYKVLNAEANPAEHEPVVHPEALPPEETRLRRLVAPLKPLVERIRVTDVHEAPPSI